MKRIALAALLLLSCGTTRNSVDAILAAHPGKTIAVAYYDLATGETLLRNERVVFHAASTMKVPVMLGIFDAVRRGTLRLDQPVRVKNDFVSILDGSHYALEAREDSDPTLYDAIGTDVPLSELVRRMIVRSSNLATNIVIEFIGAPRVMELMKNLGANDIQVLRGVEDDKAYHAGMNNTTTAYDLMLIFRAIAGEKELLDILLAQEHNDGIPAGLPPGTRVAHKTGSITAIAHDAGIVYRPDGSAYVLVVLTRGFKKTSDAEKVIAEVARVADPHAAGRRAGGRKRAGGPRYVPWAWERRENLRFLGEHQTVAAYAGLITLTDRVDIAPRRNPLFLAKNTKRIAVVRIETNKPALDAKQRAETIDAIQRLARDADALQIDFDAMRSERAFYRDLLHELRANVKGPLTITALASWCMDDRWLAGLPIDEAVPMLFQMGSDGDAIRARLARGEEFREPLCRMSSGISLDEPLDVPRGQRVWIFNPEEWSEEAWTKYASR